MLWFIIKNKNGKYADGYYGWDATIHSTEQIFAEDEVPYISNTQMSVLLAGVGNKPTVNEVIAKDYYEYI